MPAKFFLGWILVFAGLPCGWAQTFLDAGVPFPRFGQSDLACADFDNDGDLDLLMADTGEDGVAVMRVYRNEGGGWSPRTVAIPAWSLMALSVADFDRDGLLDVAALVPVAQPGQMGGVQTALYRNLGGLDFSQVDLFPGAEMPGTPEWGDLDNDGDPDLLLLGNGFSSGTFYLRNDGTTFHRVRTSLPPARIAHRGATADFDGDGNLDLLLLGHVEETPAQGEPALRLFRNEGRGEFSRVPLDGVLASGEIQAGDRSLWFDEDHDGDLDLLLHHHRQSTLLRNRGPAGFQRERVEVPDFFSGDSGDLNGDGLTDLFLNLETTGTAAFRLPAGGFRLEGSVGDSGGGSIPLLADFDRDGRLDVLWPGRLFRNTGSTVNSHPRAPGGLRSQLRDDGSVLLSWNPASDRETPSAALTYSVMLGRTPGGTEVICPPADPITGFRRMPGRPEIQGLNRPVEGLAPGTYFWKVQTVDAGFAGSPWSVQGSFAIVHTAPTVQVPETQRIGPGQSAVVTVTVADAQSPSDRLIVTVESEDELLLPSQDLSLTGNGADRELRFRAVTGRTGSTRLTIAARNVHGLVTRRSFEIVVEEFSFEPLVREAFVYHLFSSHGLAADWDGDGDLDLLVRGTGSGGDFRGIALNDGRGHFLLRTGLTYPDEAVIADFDRDGDLDLFGANQMAVNDGTGHFDIRSSPLLDGISVPLRSGDMDGDGDVDLVTSAFLAVTREGERVQLFRSLHAKFEADPRLSPDESLGSNIEVADLDGDGDLDVVFGMGATSAGMPPRLCINRGDGIFAPPIHLPDPLEPGTFGEFRLVDDDDDGDLDFLVVRSPSMDAVRLDNDGMGSFRPLPRPPTLGYPTGDLDNDGRTDQFLPVQEPGFINGQFLLHGRLPNGTLVPRSLRLSDVGKPLGDFDQDGDLDLIAAQWVVTPLGTFPQLVLIRNNCLQTNSPPGEPSALPVIQGGDRVTIGWAPPLDDHTPSPLLTYQIRMGTTPGAADVMSPGTSVARPGDAGNVAHHDFYHLPSGTYFWSVCALDSQFQAGPWSKESSFIVDRPLIEPVSDVTTPPGAVSHPIAIRVTGDSQHPAERISLRVESENLELIPQEGLSLEGDGSLRVLRLRTSNAIGGGFVTVRAASPSGMTAVIRFWVQVSRFEVRDLAEPGWDHESLSWLDLDLDGRLDVLGLGSEGLTVWRNLGGGRLSGSPVGFPGSAPARVMVGDQNGDDRADLALVEFPGDPMADPLAATRLWKGQGGTNFSAVSGWLTNVSLAAAALDRDGDGVGDFVHWMRREGSGFSPWLTGRPNDLLRLSSLEREIRLIGGYVWSDLDGDGDLDLVVSGHEGPPGLFWGNSFLRGWRRQGNGELVPMELGLPADLWCRLAAADLTGDGLPELFTGPLDTAGAGGPRLWRNLGDGRFEELQAGFPPFANGAPAWGDFDNDGDPDLITTTTANFAFNIYDPSTWPLLWINDGSGRFEAIPGPLATIVNSDAAWGDADGDGDLDLLLSGTIPWAAPGRRLLINTSVRSNTPPTPPAELRALQENDGLELAWSAGEDAEDRRFLTYNLRLGTTPGGSEVLSAIADPKTGTRRLGGPGNMHSSRRWRLPHLPNGTYFWSVQTVDAGYADSGFAAEQSFRVRRAVISGPTNLVLSPHRTAGPFAFEITDPETPAASLQVVVRSGTPDLLPPGNLEFQRSGSRWLLTLTPAAHQSGKGVIELRVSDEAGEISWFRLPVTVLEELVSLPTVLPALHEGVAVWMDANQDGWMDLLAGGYANTVLDGSVGECRIWSNHNGSFAPFPMASFNNAGMGAAVIGDPDGDNDLDVAVSGGTGDARVHWQTGPGRFGMETPLPPATRSLSAWGDADGDGDLDLVVSGPPELQFISGSRAHLVSNLGGRNLATGSLLSDQRGLRDGDAEWADFDGDGDADLLLVGSRGAGPGLATSMILFNEEDGLRERPTGIAPAAMAAASIADFDLDGDPDLVVCGMALAGEEIRLASSLYVNDGSGRFTLASAPFTPVSAGGVAWGDYDGDGDPDLVLSGRTTTGFITELWVNEGGSFLPTKNFFAGASARGAAWGDLDRDGDLDLALVGRTEGHSIPATGPGTAHVFRNEMNFVPPLPPVPVELSATADGNDILVAWRIPEGSPQGLSFNVRVGTSPGAGDVMSAMADPTTGHRWIPAHGNAGWSGRWRLRGQTGRTLHWTVQSIGPDYRASAFAAEKTIYFTPNLRPYLNPLPDISAQMNAPIPPAETRFGDPDDPTESLILQVSSSNPSVLRNEDLMVQRDGDNVRIAPQLRANVSGATRVTILVEDPKGSRAETSFLLVVRAFTEFEAGRHPLAPIRLEAGDADGDGDSDLLLSGWQPDFLAWSSRVDVLLGDGTGALVRGTAEGLQAGAFEAGASWADWDLDGDFDVSAAGILWRNTSGDFIRSSEQDPDPQATLTWGDVDGDGDLDAVRTGGLNRSLEVLRNDGGMLVSVPTILPPVRDGVAAWGDANNDGLLDLAVSGRELESDQAYPRLRLYRNDAGLLTEISQSIGIHSGHLQWADINGDGLPDLLVSGRTPDRNRGELWLNLGRWRFHALDLSSKAPGVAPFPGALLADFDNDGRSDLAEFTSAALWVVRLNDGRGAFSPGAWAFASHPSTALAAADFDGDGDFDIAAGGFRRIGDPSFGAVQIFRNHWRQDSPGITRRRASIEGSDVVLEWPRPFVTETGRPMTSNLRVGRRPGSGEVVSPLSLSETGRRQVLGPGNCGFADRTRLRGLAPGVYYWSVQSVDAAGRGSGWSPNEVFTITAALRPVQIRVEPAAESSRFRVRIGGPPGHWVLIESSSNLHDWQARPELRIGADGFAFAEVSGEDASTFFRATVVP